MSGINERELALAIGHEISYWRKRRGVDRKSLAKLIRKSENTVGRYERGNTLPTIAETWRICDALAVPISEFVARVDRVVRPSVVFTSEVDDASGEVVITLPSGERVVVATISDAAPPARETLSEDELRESEEYLSTVRLLAAKRGKREPDDQ